MPERQFMSRAEELRFVFAERDRLRAENARLREALRGLCATARTFRNVPKDEQEWGPLDDEALDNAFAALSQTD